MPSKAPTKGSAARRQEQWRPARASRLILEWPGRDVHGHRERFHARILLRGEIAEGVERTLHPRHRPCNRAYRPSVCTTSGGGWRRRTTNSEAIDAEMGWTHLVAAVGQGEAGQ
jgi:hypothetical protein